MLPDLWPRSTRLQGEAEGVPQFSWTAAHALMWVMEDAGRPSAAWARFSLDRSQLSGESIGLALLSLLSLSLSLSLFLLSSVRSYQDSCVAYLYHICIFDLAFWPRSWMWVQRSCGFETGTFIRPVIVHSMVCPTRGYQACRSAMDRAKRNAIGCNQR